MYKLEKQKYGLKLTLSGDIIEDEIVGIKKELYSLAESLSSPFSILVDAREMMTLNPSLLHLVVDGQKMIKELGRQFTAFVLNSPVIMNQVKRISFESGSTDAIRYIFADNTDDWERVAFDWIIEGIEPDPNVAVKK